MKKRKLLYAALAIAITVAFSSCFHDHDTWIGINDDEDEYRMRASFDRDLTGEIEGVINRHLHQRHSPARVHVFSGKEITLDDGTEFYVKINPGRLRIKIDKQGDDEEISRDLRDMCEEIKEVISNNRRDNE